MPALVLWILPNPPLLAQSDGENESARLLREAVEQYRSIASQWDSDKEWHLFGSLEMVDPAVARREIARLQPVMAMFRRIVREGRPEFPFDPNGLNTYAPHLMLYRSMASALSTDLGWRIHTGDTHRVGEDLRDLYSFASFLRDDGTFISSLIECSLVARASHILHKDAIPAGLISADAAQQIRDAIDAQLSHDPFGLTAGLDQERVHLTEWMLRMNESDESRAQLLDSLSKMTLSSLWEHDHLPDVAFELTEMPPQEVEAAIHGYDAAMQAIVSATAIEDLQLAKAEYDRVVADIEAGLFGPFALALAPKHNLVETIIRSLELINDVQSDLETIIRDPEGRENLLNAAIWYRRAFGERNRIDAENWRFVKSVADDSLPLLSEDAKRVIELTTPAVEHLLQASEIERCDFEPDRLFSGPLWPRLDHHDPMRDCATILLASSRAHHAMADVESSAKRLAAGLIMVEHLAQDRLIETAILSEEVFQRVAPEVEAILKDVGEVGTVTTTLKKAIDRLNRDDPFGFARAIRMYPDLTTKRLIKLHGQRDRREELGRWILPQAMQADSVIKADPALLMADISKLSFDQFRAALQTLDGRVASCVDRCLGLISVEEVAEFEGFVQERIDQAEADASMPTWTAMYCRPLVDAARRRLESSEEFTSWFVRTAPATDD